MNGKGIRRDIERVVCVLPIQAEAIPRWEVTCPKGKMVIKPCSKRSMISKRSYVVRNGGDPLPNLIHPLMTKGMMIIGKGQGFHQVKPFLMKRSTTINADIKARLIKA